MLRFKNFQRIVSGITAASIVFCCVISNDYYKALATDASSYYQVVNTGVDQNYITSLGGNMLAGSLPTDSAGKQITINGGQASVLTDGKAFVENDHIDIWGNTASLALDMGESKPIKTLLFAGMYDSKIDYTTAKYELYISDTLATVFSVFSKVATYDNTGVWQPDNAPQGAGQAFIFNDDDLPVGRYVGVKVIKANAIEDGCIRIGEVGAYGVPKKTVVNDCVTVNTGIDQSYLNDMGYNLLTGRTPVSGVPIFDNNDSIMFYVNEGSASNMTDSSSSTKADIYNGNNIKFAYDMGADYTIDKLFMSGMYNDEKDYCTAAYEIYVSNDLNTIFAESNKMVKYDNTGVWQAHSDLQNGSAQAFLFDGDARPQGRYVGIRILKANNVDTVSRLSEIGVFCNDLGKPLTIKNTGVDQTYVNSLGTSLITGKEPMTNVPLTDNAGYGFYVNDGQPKNLTDGNLSTKIDIWNGDNIKFAYDLNGVYAINSILISGYYHNTSNYSTAKYEVYASKNPDTIFNESNKLFIYDNTGVWVSNSASGDGASQSFLYDENARPEARYVGIKILDANPTDGVARISEIGIYSDKQIVDAYHTYTDNITQNYLDGMGTNLLTGIYPTDVDGNICYPSSGDIRKLTDGEILTDNAHIDFYKHTEDFIFDLKKTASIKKFLLSGMYNSGTDYTTAEYAVYVSNDINTLYDDANQKIYHNNEGIWKANSASFAGAAQAFEFTNGCEPSGRYIGVRILKCNSVDDGDIRLSEIAAFVKQDNYSYSTQTSIPQNEWDNNGTSQLTYSAPVVKDKCAQKVSPVSGNTSLLTDGDTATAVDFGANDRGFTIAYDMTSGVEINKVLFSQQQAIQKYALYASDNLKDLFLWSNKIAEYNNSGNSTEQMFSFSSTESLPKGRYFGIKLLSPQPVSICELAVYGTNYSMPYTVLNGDITQQNFLKLGDNILSGMKPKIFNSSGEALSPLTSFGISEINDNTIYQDHCDLRCDSKQTYISYDTGDNNSFSDVLIAGIYHSEKDYSLNQYEIYVSQNASDLFSNSNKVVYYDNSNAWNTNTPNSGAAQIFSFRNMPYGRYLGIKILKPNAVENDNCARIDEIAAYTQPYTMEPKNLIDSTKPVEGYIENSEAMISQADKNVFSDQKKEMLCDGQTSNQNITLNSDSSSFSIVYDLCTSSNLNEFNLYSADIAEYTLYVAPTAEGVWENSAVLSTVSVNGGVGIYKPSSPVTARYVRFEIKGNASRSKLDEISVVGTTGRPQTYRNVVLGSDAENVYGYIGSPSGTSKQIYPFPDNYGVSGACVADGNKARVIDIWGAEYGKETLDIVINLNGPKALNKLAYYGMAGYPEYGNLQIKYYVGDSLKDVFSDSSLVAATERDTRFYSDEVNFSPVLGSFVRVSLVNSCDQSVAFGSMLACVTEVEAYGIEADKSLSGNTAKTFYDSDTGISAELNRNSSKDLCLNFDRMEVTQGILSNTECSSMKNQSYGAASMVYNITFYNRANEKINDFEGRQIKTTIPLPNEIPENTINFATISDNEVNMVFGLPVDGKMSYTDMKPAVPIRYILLTDSAHDISSKWDMSSVKTGDGQNPWFAGAIAVISLAALTILLFIKKGDNNYENKKTFGFSDSCADDFPVGRM